MSSKKMSAMTRFSRKESNTTTTMPGDSRKEITSNTIHWTRRGG